MMNKVYNLDPYPNATDRQRALSLYVFTALVLILLVIALLVQGATYLLPDVEDEAPIFIFSVASTFVLFVITFWLAHRGRLRLASWLFVLSGLYLATLGHSSISVSFISIIWITLAIAGLICRTEDMRWVTGLTFGVVLLNFVKVWAIYEEDLPAPTTI
jgi:hypothetical protein